MHIRMYAYIHKYINMNIYVFRPVDREIRLPRKDTGMRCQAIYTYHIHMSHVNRHIYIYIYTRSVLDGWTERPVCGENDKHRVSGYI